MSGAQWSHRRWNAMGSTAELLVWGPRAEILATRAVAHVEGLEQCWSRFRPDSALSALNMQAGRGPQTVHGLLALAIQRAREATALTAGRFDPTVLGALRTLGYDRTFTRVRARTVSAPDRGDVPGLAAVEFHDDPNGLVVDLPAGVQLDLGGIGKGLAADLVVDDLRAHGAVSVCCALGGDIRVGGPGPDADAAWSVPVEDPRTTRRLFSFDLSDDAIAQSSVLERRWRRPDGSEHHHIVDPRTGAPAATGLVGAVVTSRRAWEADVLAKAAVIAGVDAAFPMLAAAGADAWLFPTTGSPLTTASMRGTLEVNP